MEKKVLLIRSFLLLAVWAVLAVWVLRYALQEMNGTRFEFLVLSNGTISVIQQETWFDESQKLQPNDQLIRVGRQPFDLQKTKAWLNQQRPGSEVSITVSRADKDLTVNSTLKRYSKGPLLSLFYFPVFLSLIFLGFAIGLAFHRAVMRRAREAVEVFSIICFWVSLFFLSFLPSVSLGMNYSFSITTPLLGIFVMHLFLVYPKKKGEAWLRNSFLTMVYLAGLGISIARFLLWDRPESPWIHHLNIPILGFCFLFALGCLGNTLLTSKDFWARRRARLVSLVFGLSFVGLLSAFVAVVWTGPGVSMERILAISLIFPSAFSVIFLKSNVFDLERVFRRGLHQLLLLASAITFALLVGIGWNQWKVSPETDWMLWVAIATVVVIIARPARNWFENSFHRLIQTRVKYPQVEEIFERSHSIEEFLSALSQHFETHLNLKNISFRFLHDPTQTWKATNEQRWRWRTGTLSRFYDEPPESMVVVTLRRGDRAIGEVRFDGGDAIAFDPNTSSDWFDTVKSLSRCLELLCLREFVSVQQGFLAVGRMQALLAHEMKNPLAIIKVCSGLLANHMEGNDEAEELLRTIQLEVKRVASAIQNVFDHSGKEEKKQNVQLSALVHQVLENAKNRFPQGTYDVSYWIGGQKVSPSKFLWLFVEKEGLKQSLTNLIINSYEAGARHVNVEVHKTNQGLSILIRDDGPGIPSNLELFKPFVTTKARGTGLGLVHVKAFMERNEGQIRFHSKPGEGTSFVLEFSKHLVKDNMDGPAN